MNWNAMLDKDKRVVYWTRFVKKAGRVFARPASSVPCFLFGTQRSGTSMLMHVFELHPDTEVYQEHIDSKAFVKYRMRDLATIDRLVKSSKALFTWFKPIADSHRIREFIQRFPQGRFLWVFRDYCDNANSSLRKWTHATRAIRIVCENKTGGGFFQEGITPETGAILRKVYKPELSEFDLACLAWWGRNRIIADNGVDSLRDVMFVRYEDLVTQPEVMLPSVFRYVRMNHDPRVDRQIHANSISRHSHPELNPAVQELCESLFETMKKLSERDRQTYGKN